MNIIKPAWAIFLRTSGNCQVACKTCPAGRREEQPGGVLSVDMLDRMLTRVQEQAIVKSVAMHYYNEPLLIPHIADLVKMVKSHGVPDCIMSTNLSVKGAVFQRLLNCIDNGLDNLIISTSGYTQEIAERSHKFSDIELVKENMRSVGRYKPNKLFVRVSWHRYLYNQHQEADMMRLSIECGFNFTPYNTGVLPLERTLARFADGLTDPAEEDIVTKLPEAKKLCYERRHWNCIHMDTVHRINPSANWIMG